MTDIRLKLKINLQMHSCTCLEGCRNREKPTGYVYKIERKREWVVGNKRNCMVWMAAFL